MVRSVLIVPSNYEITVHGKKLIGSAQARRKNALLQHGTFPLGGDLSRITEVLFFTDEVTRHNAASRLLTHATTAETILGRCIHWQHAANAFMVSFQSELNLEFNPASLSEHEIQRVNDTPPRKVYPFCLVGSDLEEPQDI